jgi:hypothetical protein
LLFFLALALSVFKVKFVRPRVADAASSLVLGVPISKNNYETRTKSTKENDGKEAKIYFLFNKMSEN